MEYLILGILLQEQKSRRLRNIKIDSSSPSLYRSKVTYAWGWVEIGYSKVDGIGLCEGDWGRPRGEAWNGAGCGR